MFLGSLPKEELTLDGIWARFKEFSKPQSNEVRAWFDLITSFHQGNRNVRRMVQCCSGTSQPSKVSTRNC